MKEYKFVISYYAGYDGMKWKTFATEKAAKNFILTLKPSANIKLFELARVVKYKLEVTLETKITKKK